MMKVWLRPKVAKIEKLLTSEYVKEMTEHLWSQAIPYIYAQAAIFALFVIFLSLHIVYIDTDRVNEVLFPLLCFFTGAGFLYNISEIYLEKADYPKDPWNLVDICANSLTAMYLALYRTDSESEDRKVILAFANFACWLRVVGYFRIFEPTRYLIRMILEILKDMTAFVIILTTFIIQSALCLMALQPGESYYIYWQIAYRLAYGDFIDAEENDTHGQRIFFIVASVIMTLVLLNLLIAIMGDTFDNVQSSQKKENVRERLSLILEVSKFLNRWNRNNKEKKYIHVCTNERLRQEEEDKTWEGKVKVLQNTIEKFGTEIKNLVANLSSEMTSQSEHSSEIKNLVSNLASEVTTLREQKEAKPNQNEESSDEKVEIAQSGQRSTMEKQIEQMAEQIENLQKQNGQQTEMMLEQQRKSEQMMTEQQKEMMEQQRKSEQMMLEQQQKSEQQIEDLNTKIEQQNDMLKRFIEGTSSLN